MYRFLILCLLATGCSKKDDPTPPINETLVVESAKMQMSVSNGNINTVIFYVGTKTIELFRDDSKDASFSANNDVISSTSGIVADPMINEYILISPLNDGVIELKTGTDMSRTGGVKKVIINKISALSLDAEVNEATYIADPAAGRTYARGIINQAKTRSFSLAIY